MLRLLVLAPWIVSAAGCATLRPPSEGGRPWRELQSEHVTLYTDLSEGDAIEVVRGFEHRHHLLATTLFADAPPPLRSRVVAFHHERDFREVASDHAGAYFTPRLALDAQPIPTIVMYGGPTVDTYSIWLHELTHRFVAASMGPVPLWLNEGLAQYYSTASVDGDVLFLGRHLDDIAFVDAGGWSSKDDHGTRRLLIPITQVPPASRLMTLDSKEFYLHGGQQVDVDLNRARTANYAGAWALVHMLVSDPQHRPRYERLVGLLAEGTSPGDAICEAFGDVSAAELDADLVAYMQRNTLTVWPQAYEPPATIDPRVTAMPEARALMLWVKLGLRWPGFERRALVFLGRAMALAPKDPWVLEAAGGFARATGDLELARTHLEAARKLAPTATDPLVALMSLYDDEGTPWPAEERKEWLRAVATDLEPLAGTASELNAIAWYLARNERAEQALALSSRALATDPNCGECFDTHALVLSELGRPGEAVQAQRVAIDRMSEHASDGTLAELEARLDQYEAAAGVTNEPPSAEADEAMRCWARRP
jgi:tetratricopeptide (TPR) repeat protein